MNQYYRCRVLYGCTGTNGHYKRRLIYIKIIPFPPPSHPFVLTLFVLTLCLTCASHISPYPIGQDPIVDHYNGVAPFSYDGDFQFKWDPQRLARSGSREGRGGNGGNGGSGGSGGSGGGGSGGGGGVKTSSFSLGGSPPLTPERRVRKWITAAASAEMPFTTTNAQRSNASNAVNAGGRGVRTVTRPEPLEPLEPRRGLPSVSLGGADGMDEGEERKNNLFNNDRRSLTSDSSDSSTSTRAGAALHPPPSSRASSTASIASIASIATARVCDGGELECTTNRVNTGGGGLLSTSAVASGCRECIA